MSKFLIEYKKRKNRRNNKKNIIENIVQEIKNIDLLNTSVSELYNIINIIQQKLNSIQ